MRTLKKSFPVLVMLGMWTAVNIHAQGTFESAWTGKFTNDGSFLHFAAADGSSIVGTTKSDVCIINGSDGSVKWSGKFEDIAEIKKTDLQYYMPEAGIFLIADRKSGQDHIKAIDANTGKKLWETDKYNKVYLSAIKYLPELKRMIFVSETGLTMMDPKNGKELWTTDKFNGAMADVRYVKERDELVILNYKTSWGALFSGYKNQLMNINPNNGDVNWAVEYFGVIHNKPYSYELVFDMQIEDDKVFLMVNGLQVIDMNTGKQLWKTEFELQDHKVGLGGDSYVYGVVAYPIVKNNAVYLVYAHRASRRVELQKLNLTDGSVIWETKIDVPNAVVPLVEIKDDKIVMQIGNYVNIQGRDNNGSTYSKYRWDGPFGVMVANEKDGKIIWQNTELKKRISNLVIDGNAIYAADEKMLYAYDLSSGATKYAVDLKKTAAGPAMKLELGGDKLMLLGEDGATGFAKADGSKVWDYKAKDVLFRSEWVGGNYAVKTEDYVAIINPADGKEKGRYTYGKNAWYRITEDGKFLIHMDKKSVIKYRLS